MVHRTYNGITYEVHSPSLLTLDKLILEMNRLRNWQLYHAAKPDQTKVFASRDDATRFVASFFQAEGAL